MLPAGVSGWLGIVAMASAIALPTLTATPMSDLIIWVAAASVIDFDIAGMVLGDLVAVDRTLVVPVGASSGVGHFLLSGLVVLLIEHLGFSIISA